MSHPYRMQLPGNSGEKGGRPGKPDVVSPLHKPHQIPTGLQVQPKTKKAHPFLQHLPNEVSRSLESLHLGSPQRSYFDKNEDQIPSTRGSTTSNSPVHSSQSSIAQSHQSQQSQQTQLTNQSNVSQKSQQLKNVNVTSHDHSKKETVSKQQSQYPSHSRKINSIRQMMMEEQTVLPKEKIDTPIMKQERTTVETSKEDNAREVLEANNGINDSFDKSFDIDDYANISTGEELQTPESKNPNELNTSDQLYQISEKTKSVANLIHPVYNDNQIVDNNTETIDDNRTVQSQQNNDTPTMKSEQISILPLDKSIEMYRKNAKKTKNPETLFSFAQMLIRTALSKRDDNQLTKSERESYLDEAYSALKKSSKMGYIEAQYYLGDAFSVGLFNKGKPELSKSLSYFEIAGKSKHAESAYRTAMCYKKGWGCTRDARKVVKYLEIAAMNNHPVAMMEYGIYAFHGLMSFPEDINTKKKGISWLRRATECATELSCGAPYELALIYINGFKDIVIKDTNYAIKLLFKASNLGHSKSSSLLGKFYEVGDIVEQNPDLSIHFYNISANQGDVDGMLGLCSWYFVGSENLPQDYDEAFAWALRAAEIHHNVKAMLLMERFYQIGVGCEKDLEKSKYWGDLARSTQNKINKNKKNILRINRK